MKLFGRKNKKNKPELSEEELDKKRKDEEKEEDLKKEQKEHNKSVSKATAGVTLISISEQAINAAPILALSGIGIPLAAGLYVVGQLANTSSKKSTLNRMIEDSKYIIGSCYAQYTAMIKTVEYYIEIINEIKNKVKSKSVDEAERHIMTTSLGHGILKKIIRKLELITGLLSEVEVDPNKNSSRLGKIKRAVNRNIYGNYYINELTRELVVFQGLFSTLNTKFEKLCDSYNTKINGLKNRKILTDDDIVDINEEVDILFSKFVSMDIDNAVSNNTKQLKDSNLMEDIYEYVSKSKEVAKKYIEDKKVENEDSDKKGGNGVIKNTITRKNYYKNKLFSNSSIRTRNRTRKRR